MRWLLCLTALLVPVTLHAESQTMTCATASGTNWTNPTNILSNADTDAYASYNNTARNVLSVTNCTPNIPLDATVTGIQARVIGCGTGGTAITRRFNINLLNLGTCTEKIDNNQVQCTAWTDQTIPSGTADTWSCTDLSGINSTSFGVAIRDANTTATELREQYVEIVVTYTPKPKNRLLN